MASPRRNSTLIELIRDRPSSMSSPAPIKAERIKREPRRSERGSEGGGFDVASFGKWFAAGRRLNLPMGYVFIAAALVIASWIGMYMIGYSRAESTLENERIELLTSTADPLRTGEPATTSNNRSRAASSGATRPRSTTSRPTPSVSSDGPTGTGLPARTGMTPSTRATANRPASVLPRAEFESGLNYLVIANYHQDEAQRAAAYLMDNGIRAAVVPINSGATWRVVGLEGYTGEQMRAGEHRTYRDSIEALGRAWERDHNGSDNFSGMFFRKEKG